MHQPEHELIRQSLARFAEEHVREQARDWDARARLPEDVLDHLNALGLPDLEIDPQYPAEGTQALVVAVHELGRADASLALALLARVWAGNLCAWHGYALPHPWPGLAHPTWAGHGVGTGAWYCADTALTLWRDATPVPTAGLRALGMVALRGEPSEVGALQPARAALGECVLALGAAAVAVGLGDRALRAAGAYAATRQQFGRPISDHQGIAWKLADSATGLEAARVCLQRAAATGEGWRHAAVLANHACTRATDDAVQLLGGVGYVRDYDVERLYRDAQGYTALLGDDDHHRLHIARELFSA